MILFNLILYIVATENLIDLFNGKGTPASEQMKDYYHNQKKLNGDY